MRIGRDHYIRLETCDYSVHPAAIGRIVRVEADTETVRAHLPCVPELAPVIFGTGIASRAAMSLCQTAVAALLEQLEPPA